MFSNILSIHPLFSVLTALLSLIGISYLGRILMNFANINISYSRIHEPIIGSIIVSQIVFIFAVFGLEKQIFFVGILLIMLSVAYLKDLRGISIQSSNELNYPLSLAILCLYFLYSLTPLTNADSIDYHVGIPIHIIEYNSFPNGGEWFHARLFGLGEYLNLLGISLKTYNLGSLIQFISLLSIYFSIISNIRSDSKVFNTIMRLSIISMPVLIFLIGTSKFQLFPIALIVLSLNIYINYWEKFSSKLKVSSILFLCMSATLFKFNYLLPAFLISLITLARVYHQNRNDFITCIFISFFMFLIIMIPFYLYKSYLFEASIIDSFLSPTVGKFIGSENFLSMLQNYNESKLPFPFSIFIPDSIGKITSILGIGFLSIMFLNRDTLIDNLILNIYLVLLFILLLIFAQYTARTFLDFYFVFLMLVARSLDHKNLKLVFYKYLIYGQSFLLISLLSFGIYSSIGGIFSSSERFKVMNNQANGFEIANWIDELVPSGSSIIVTNRSMSFSDNKMISGDWIEYVNWQSDEPKFYLEKMKNTASIFIFYIKKDNNYNIPSELLSCLNSDKIVSSKVFKSAVRNPFNEFFHEVFLLEFNAQNAINCLEK